MKKIPKKKPFKLSLVARIKLFFSKYWNVLIVKPLQERKEKKQNLKNVSEIKKDFEKCFRVNINEVKAIMYDRVNHLYIDTDQRSKDLNEELVKGRQHMLNISKYYKAPPYFYDPEICEIHNENLNPSYPEIIDLKEIEHDSAKISLERQRHVGNFVNKRKSNQNKNGLNIIMSRGLLDLEDSDEKYK